MKKEYRKLLERLTAAHNKEVQRNYNDGLLDFEPYDQTPAEMLEIIISVYAMEHFPSTLDPGRDPEEEHTKHIYIHSFTDKDIPHLLRALKDYAQAQGEPGRERAEHMYNRILADIEKK